MTFFQAIFLGCIQGLTEFLPISSSGHLIFIPQFLSWPDQGLVFDVVVHLGTLFAVVIYFRQELWLMAGGILGFHKKGIKNYELKIKEYRRLGWLILLSIIPAGIVGFFFGDYIEATFRSASVIGWGLIGWGIVLYAADRFGRRYGNTLTLKHMDAKRALFIGAAQAIALIPGTSRSGITMTAGLFSTYTKKAAAEFSFLMSVPIIALAGVLKIVELIEVGLGDVQISVLLVGCFSAAVSGFVAIWGLLRVIERWSFLPFAAYRVAVGIVVLLFLA